jgi:hypothetical protein
MTRAGVSRAASNETEKPSTIIPPIVSWLPDPSLCAASAR